MADRKPRIGHRSGVKPVLPQILGGDRRDRPAGSAKGSLIQIIRIARRACSSCTSKWESQGLTSYRVCFFNEIPRNDRIFKCCQRSNVVRSAASPEQGVAAAKEQLLRLEGVRDWRIHASCIAVAEVKEGTSIRERADQSIQRMEPI